MFPALCWISETVVSKGALWVTGIWKIWVGPGGSRVFLTHPYPYAPPVHLVSLYEMKSPTKVTTRPCAEGLAIGRCMEGERV